MEDNSIVQLYLDRNESAITETDRKYRQYLFKISYNILSHSEDSLECVNDTYFRAWNSIPPQIPHKLSAFLGRITRNLSLDRYRKVNASRRIPDNITVSLEELSECIPSGSDASKVVDDMHLTEVLNDFLSGLKKRDRIVFVKKYWYLHSVKDIAKDMKMSEASVKMSLLRSRKTLRNTLSKEGICL